MRSLKSRINIGFILISTITALVTGGVGIILGIRHTEIEAREKLTLMVSSYASELENSITLLKAHSDAAESMVLSIWTSHNAESELQKKQRLAEQMMIYAKKSRTNSLWVVFTAKYTPQPPHTISLFDSTEKGYYTFEPDYSILDIDTTQSDTDWWKNAQKYGESWTNPYLWKPWNKTIISYARKFTINGQFAGVLGSDFFFDALKKRISEAKVYNSGYFWIMDQKYKMILHPTLQDIDVRTVDNGFIIDKVRAMNMNSGTLTYTYDHQTKILAFKTLSNRWTLCMSVPYKEIYRQQQTIITAISGIMIILLILAVAISRKLSRSITNPLTNFIATFKKGADGDLTVRTDTTSRVNEIATLSESFNHFISKLEWHVKELTNTKESLTQAMAKAEESNRLKSAFLANISHEIRTPLNAVIGFSELLKKAQLSHEEKTHFSELVVKNAYTLLRTMNDVIQVSKLESGNVYPNYTKVSVDAILNTAFDEYKKQRGTYTISSKTEFIVESNPAYETAFISTDVQLLQLILSHLVENSIKFTAQGHIKLGALISTSTVVFYVEDTGIGIEAGQKERIFDLFYKAQDSDDKLFGGSGLGLSIAKKISDLLGASLWFESEPGAKTTFFLGASRTKP